MTTACGGENLKHKQDQQYMLERIPQEQEHIKLLMEH
jgi:hypothetical protein